MNNPVRKFYVYVIIDPTTEEPIYIGKGCGDRMRVHLAPSNLKRSPRVYRRLRELLSEGHQPIFRKVLEDLTELESLAYEQFLILALGQVGATRNPGPLFNVVAHQQKCMCGIKRVPRGPNPNKRFKGIFNDCMRIGDKIYPGNVWCARIKVDKKYKSLGRHPSAEAAAGAFDIAAIQHQDDPWLNFPGEHGRVNLVVAKPQPKKMLQVEMKSKYNGVLPVSIDRWRMQIAIHGEKITCNRYPTEIEAARAYDELAVQQVPGRELNFPEDWDGLTCLRPLAQPVEHKTVVRMREPRNPNIKCNPAYRRYRKPHREKKFKGVCVDGIYFIVSISTKGSKKHIGMFRSEREAARAYDAAAIEYHGEGWLNFKPSAKNWVEPTFNVNGQQMSGYTGFWDKSVRL